MKSKTESKNLKFHLWIPDIFQFKGGIQVYSAYFLTALQTSYPDANYEVYLKNDTHVVELTGFSFFRDTQYHFFGKLPKLLRTIYFSLYLFISGWFQKPDLIISTHINFTPLAYLLKQITGIPYWAIAHGVESWNITNPSLQNALTNIDLLLPVSNYTKQRLLQEQNIKPTKIKVLANTFDIDRFEIASKPDYLLKKHNLKPNQPIILTVGRLAGKERYKGYDEIIKALPQILTSIPDVHYIIVGKGKDEARIKLLIEDLGLGHNVTLAGFIPDEQLSDYYNLCDVFAMPSKGEGFGIVYLEALACGKPVLGGNQDGALDALCNGELGALVNPDDVAEIASVITSILQGNYPNKLLYQPENLRKKVNEIYGLENFTQTLKNFLEEFLQHQKP